MKKKLILLLVTIIAVVTVFTGCGGPQEIKRPEPDGTTVEVTGSCEARLDGDKLIVTGETNLMDGTNGIASVLNANGITLEQQKFKKEGETLTFEFPVKSEWPEVVYAFISFDTQKSDGQSDEVKKAYGKQFQNLTGKNTIWNSQGVIAIFHSEEVKVK